MDSPRSWVVAVACCWINVFTFALVRSSAVVYVALIHTFSVTRERASWPANLAGVCYFLTSPIAGALARYIPIWKLSVVGCLGGSLAICACFFATSMLFLDIFVGFIHGTSLGLLSLYSVVVNQHFLKYRAVASGIANAGFTVGGFLFPPVMKAVDEKYGIHGTFLIFGAIILNSVAGALLQRTPPQTQQDEDTTGALSHDSDGRSVITKREDEFLRPHKSSDCPQILDGTSSCGSNGTTDRCCQMIHLLPSEAYDIDCDEKSTSEWTGGISAWNGVYLISVYAVSDLMARLGSGWITDRKYLRKSTMMCSHLALWGASLCLMPLCSSYPILVALSVLLGWCNGSTIILIVVFFMELVGLDKVGVCFGCANAVAGLAGLARPLLIGFFRDTHKDYAGLFTFSGGATMCVSLLWLYYRVREQCVSMRKDAHSSRICSMQKDCVSTS
ncbi:hypothetical protein MTO96_048235 [Rhipicephalus appendiculatus]